MWKERAKDLATTAALVISGTLCVVLAKASFDIVAFGRPGAAAHTFDKPWFNTFIMFLGEFCSVFIYLVPLWKRKLQRRRSSPGERLRLLSVNEADKQISIVLPTPETTKESDNDHILTLKNVSLCCVPALCDFVGSLILTYGLIWIDASLYSMLQGANVVFTAIVTHILWKFTRAVMGKKALIYEWIGVVVVTIGLFIVGLSYVLKMAATPVPSMSSSSHVQTAKSMFWHVLGIAFCVVGQLLWAIQTNVEAYFLQKTKDQLPSYFVVGFEGMWGMIVTGLLLIACNWLPQPLGEDTLDTFYMLASPALIFLNLAYVVAIFFFNNSGMIMTKRKGAVFCQIIRNIRIPSVWIVQIVLYYTISQTLGEGWDSWSSLRLCGFLLLVAGVLIHDAILRIHGLTYPEVHIVQ
jgi:hypothetical protein